MKKLLLTILIALLVPMSSFAYVGSLSTADGGITATGNWGVNGFKISWDVTQMTEGYWCYQYWLTDLQGNTLVGEPSHLTLEISPNVPTDRFWDFGGVVEFGDFDGISNSMKLDYAGTHYSFYSLQVPVWGDFYSKDGRAGGYGFNTAMNSSFGTADPTAAADDGSIGYKILRPDTVTDVPEPGTMLLFGLGMAGAGIVRKVRKNKK